MIGLTACSVPEMKTLMEVFTEAQKRAQAQAEDDVGAVLRELLGAVVARDLTFVRLPGDPPVFRVEQGEEKDGKVTFRVTYTPGRLMFKSQVTQSVRRED